MLDKGNWENSASMLQSALFWWKSSPANVNYPQNKSTRFGDIKCAMAKIAV